MKRNKIQENEYLDEGRVADEVMPVRNLPDEIKTLEEMTSFLTQLQESASDSVEAALNAQLQVIRFVQSPSLVDTTLDTLLLNLKKALRYAESPKMEDELRERFSLMIQNYVFFFDARMQVEVNENKKEAKKLFDTAGQMLSQSVTDVALMAVPGGTITKKALMGVVVKNVFAQDDSETKGFFQKLWKWWNSSRIMEEKKAEFYQTLLNIITKLDKYNELIGPSMLIHGMIERYTPDISNYAYQLKLSEIEDERFKQESFLESTRVVFHKPGWTVTVFVLGMVSILFRWIWYGLCSMGSTVVSWFMDDYVATEHTGWFLAHFYWVLGITAVIELICMIGAIRKRKQIKERIRHLGYKLEKKQKEKEDFEQSLYAIAEKYDEV